jgi:hydroxylamine reductase (hybrid-cluster protein)
MSPATLSIVEWYAAGAAAVAALLVSLDLGRRVTGVAFIIFVTSSIAFITYGLLDPQPEEAIASLNFALLGINLFGVWQYLLSPKNRRKQEVIKEAVEEFEEQEKAEGRA